MERRRLDPSRQGAFAAWPAQLRNGLGLVAGLGLLWLGGAAINAPISLGPMRLGLAPLAGLVELAAGTALLALLPPPWSRPAWALAIPALLATVGRNFIIDPPLDDGAWRQLRLGLAGGGEDTWPAGPEWTVLGVCPLAIAIAGAASRARAPFVQVAIAAVVFCAAGSLVYAPFVRELTDNGDPFPAGWLLPAAFGVAGVVGLRRGGAWRLAGVCCLALAGLCLATWAIYASVLP